MSQIILTAEAAARSYRKEIKSLRIMRVVTLVVYLLVLWFLKDRLNPITALLSVVIFLLALQFLRMLQTQQFSALQRILNQECDATKYTEIMERLAQEPDKDINAIKLCLARGQYCCGRFEEALETLQSFYVERPSAGTALLYRSTAFGCHAELEDLEKARAEREEVIMLMHTVPPKQRGSIQQQLLVMDAILALKEERYDDFFPLQKQALEEAVAPLQKVIALYYLAQGELVQGNDADVREHLEQVADWGCTTFMAAEAANLLEELTSEE